MKSAGIIAEYNPFHKGHEFHLQKTRELTDADCIIVVMSGNFVQRGEPAIMDKFLRAECALRCGADLILELSLPHAVLSAESFSRGAVSLLSALHVNFLSFGSECGDIEILTQIANLLNNEPPQFKEILKDCQKKGASFPKARETALSSIQPEFGKILSTPNNTLGVEYVRAILKKNLDIRPITLKREGAAYNDNLLHDGQFCSATALRSLLAQGDCEQVSSFVPPAVFSLMQKNYRTAFPIYADDFSSLLYYRLALLAEQNADFTKFCDVTPALANRIMTMMKTDNQPRTFYQTAELLKTKDITHSRIMRCLLHVLLNLCAGEPCWPSHVRILGLNETGKKYLSSVKKDCALPLITKPAAAKDFLKKDNFATSLYNQAVFSKYGTVLKNDYTHQIVQ